MELKRCFALLVVLMVPFATAEQSKPAETRRKAKLFPVFQVIQFENDGCPGSSGRNGTCFSPAECTAKGGTSSGTCASGYGVCCVFTLACGGTTSANCTYLVQTSITKAPATDPCTYTICKCSSNICRIRLDFTNFQIVGPVVGSTAQLTTATASSTNGGGIGDCVTDAFSFGAPSNTGSPIICGINTGQHMIVDASDSCNIATFDIGATGATRQWDIKVTQYACGDEQGGPAGCLQYYTGVSGRISNFNFPTTATTIGPTTTHLSHQCYTMCIRQEMGKCAICYTTSVTNTVGNVPENDNENAQTSFGLSLSGQAGTPVTSQLGPAQCTSDYLIIPNAQAFSTMLMNNIGGSANRFCGRVFTTISTGTAAQVTGTSVCSTSKPFHITFKADAQEVTGTDTPGAAAIAANSANLNEQSLAPGGIVGFSLNYVQQNC